MAQANCPPVYICEPLGGKCNPIARWALGFEWPPAKELPVGGLHVVQAYIFHSSSHLPLHVGKNVLFSWEAGTTGKQESACELEGADGRAATPSSESQGLVNYSASLGGGVAG